MAAQRAPLCSMSSPPACVTGAGSSAGMESKKPFLNRGMRVSIGTSGRRALRRRFIRAALTVIRCNQVPSNDRPSKVPMFLEAERNASWSISSASDGQMRWATANMRGA
jgi:hypothetical protein